VSSRPSTTDSSGHETAQDGIFVTLKSAKYLLLTTFKQDGTPMAVPVRVAVDGDRAYFGVRDFSGTANRLRRTDWVQVVRCTPLGMASFGPRVNATARPLDGAEAGQAAERLARTRPAWREFARSLASRVTRRQTVYYELRPDEVAKQPAPPPPAVTARVVRTRTARRGQQLPPVPLR
jgi:PPOX class probable F420-dependent enzyme